MTQGSDLPLVSAVIPTRNRPNLVCRAVRSALQQSYTNLEVVVVVDGPDPATVASLEALNEPRLRIVALEENVGGSEARNIGAREAGGEWVAFLDDDDEWLPAKIERQQRRAAITPNRNLVIACRFFEKGIAGDRVLPLRVPDANEPISEYLFCPKKFSIGEGFLQTSSLFVPRALLIQIPFVKGLRRGQEYTWLMTASLEANSDIIVMPDILAIFYADSASNRISSRPHWRDLLGWMQTHPRYITPRSLSYYIAGGCIIDAVTCREPLSIYLKLLYECVHHGKADVKCILLFLYRWLIRRRPQQRVIES